MGGGVPPDAMAACARAASRIASDILTCWSNDDAPCRAWISATGRAASQPPCRALAARLARWWSTTCWLLAARRRKVGDAGRCDVVRRYARWPAAAATRWCTLVDGCATLAGRDAHWLRNLAGARRTVAKRWLLAASCAAAVIFRGGGAAVGRRSGEAPVMS
ncbi:hypothetical protein F511_44187 [Dorcoceras hygrometricum]|uniref:Uncharacterized protein n=1 Tax=Dorcoceras hygrometricum TaxID=472368 RepID=A0A2Z7BWP5_9LAMI|nr:hypothetical protein F511_44187 [Dorcoceras hygrometricum]